MKFKRKCKPQFYSNTQKNYGKYAKEAKKNTHRVCFPQKMKTNVVYFI